MSRTTIRLPGDLKARVARAAKAGGTTSHDFLHARPLPAPVPEGMRLAWMSAGG